MTNTITLETIQARQDELVAMIAAFNAAKITITIPAATIELRPGEHYAGLVLNDGGTPSHHLVLTARQAPIRLSWQDAISWARSIDGALPTRREMALIRIHCLNHVEPGGYWLNEPCEGNSSYAWTANFSNGAQYGSQKSSELCVVAVRRIPIGGGV